MKIIGIGGSNGSGKDTVSRMLADDYGWYFISVSEDLLIPALRQLGLPVEREQMAALGTSWRKELGMGANIDKALALYKSQAKDYPGLVISSLRHPGEADRVHELGGQVVWVDADPKLRYERIFNRKQGDKDQKTFEQFLAEERAEMAHAGDEATLNMSAVKDRADIFITNHSNDLDEFKKLVKERLGL